MQPHIPPHAGVDASSPARPRRIDWWIVSLYPIVLTSVFAAIIAYTTFVGEPRDQKFTGWSAFWVALFLFSGLLVPLALLSHVVGLILATKSWGALPKLRLVVVEVVAGMLHPLGWYFLSDSSRPAGTGWPPFFTLWLFVGPAIVVAVLAWVLGRLWHRRTPDVAT